MSREKRGCEFYFGHCVGRLKDKTHPNSREVGGASRITFIGVIACSIAEIALEDIQ